MMAPLAMANNFNGPYYAGPSGAAMGALMAAQSIGDGLRDWGASKGRQQYEARVQEERDRVRMDELTQRQAVAQAINPNMQMNSSNGMSNRDMTRKMALPNASTQMGIYKLQEAKDQQAQEQKTKNLSRVATFWAINGGETADPGGKQFMQKFGYSPYEYADPNVISRMQDKQSDRDLRLQMAEGQRENARLIAGMRQGGGESTYRFMPMVGQDGTTKIMAIDPKDPFAAPIEVGQPPQKRGEGSNGLLPLDTAGRKSLAEWVASTTDAARVASTMDAAMGATVDPQTGEKKYKAQPSGPLSGGTGMILGALPDKVAARVDPDGVSVRSAIANFSSQIMNALSGAAVSEQEKKRLEAFLPTGSDDWKTLRQKMTDYKDFLRSKGDALGATYGDHEVLNRGMGILGGKSATRQSVGPRPGTVIDGYEYLGGDPNAPGSWRSTNGK